MAFSGDSKKVCGNLQGSKQKQSSWSVGPQGLKESGDWEVWNTQLLPIVEHLSGSPMQSKEAPIFEKKRNNDN